MVKVLLSDFSHVLVFPKDFSFRGSLSKLVEDEDPYFINEELFSFYKKIKEEYSLQLFIYTSGSVYTHSKMQNFVFPLFEKVFTSSGIGFHKNNPEAYLYLAKTIGADPSEIIFVDDSTRNASAAREAGLHGVDYHDNAQTIQTITQILENR
jgi:FMN phosphatase YigB (HAD superfamily)